MSTTQVRLRDGEAGFSLVETVIAMGILATGLLSLAGVFSLGMAHVAGSSANLIAREKAREAVESVHTARDTKTILWAAIQNVSAGGVFLNDAQPLKIAGPDGLVNTTDDGQDPLRTYCHPNCYEEQLGPGPDNVLGTSDDIRMPLTLYTRVVEITEILDGAGVPNPTLRRIRVTVTYPVGRTTRTYTITTFISAIS